MFRRLTEFYKRSVIGSDQTMSEIWKVITQTCQVNLNKALHDGNEADVKHALDNLVPSNEVHGMEECDFLKPWNPRYLDFLNKLAYRTGVLPIYNQEQPSPTENWMHEGIGTIQPKIESELGFKLKVPACFGAEENTLPHRFFYYASAAYTAERFMGKKPVDILEIGAGLGNLGLIGKHWGSKTYTVIDLPSCAVIAAYFVAQCCGEDKVWLAGEKWRSDAYAYFYPSTNYDEVREFAFDLIFNSDSFPEIVPAIQDAYIKLATECLTNGGIFLSINHESDKAQQSRVYDAVKRNGGLKLAYRAPFMMRDGYVEEIYRLA